MDYLLPTSKELVDFYKPLVNSRVEYIPNVINYYPDKLNTLKSKKILAIGRVQSGKTSFFISCIAFAFDNGYDIAYLVGGTKNTLRDQNYERVIEYFANISAL